MNLKRAAAAALVAALLSGCAEMSPRVVGVRSVDPAAGAALAADPTVLIVDVSDGSAYSEAHLARAVSIPRDQLRFRLHEIPAAPSRRVLVYDEEGRRAHSAGVLIEDETGDDVFVLAGGLRAWRRAGLPTGGRDGASYVLN
jgi:rhodanese-related sulfurtransferase